jgi:hypothetical protein
LGFWGEAGPDEDVGLFGFNFEDIVELRNNEVLDLVEAGEKTGFEDVVGERGAFGEDGEEI